MSNSKKVIEYRRRIKLKSIAYKGGACIVCEYNKCIRAMHFHHIIPEDKSFGLSDSNTRSWERTKKELSKCVLLCSNCHCEVHDDLVILEEHLHKNPNEEQSKLLFEEYLKDNPHLRIEKRQYHCVGCKKLLKHQAKRCLKCFHKNSEKIDWPNTDILIERVEKGGYEATGRELGVSGNAVKKRIRNHPIVL